MGGKPKRDLPESLVRETIETTEGNVTKAAEALRLPRSTMDSTLQRMGLKEWAAEVRKNSLQRPEIGDFRRPKEGFNSKFWRKKFEDCRKELDYVRRLRKSTFDLQEPRTRLPKWTVRAHKRSTDIPVLFTSDFQWGEVIDRDEMSGFNSFDLDIAKARYRQLIGSTIDICQNYRQQGSYPGIVYLRGGDSVSGDIHEELQRTNEVPSTMQVLDLFGEELRGIQLLQEAFGKVVVISVPGNHGRLTRKPIAKKYADWNFDHMLSLMLEKACSSKDVTFVSPPSGEAYFSLYGQKFLLTHGDRIGSRGGQGFIGPIATITRGVKKTRDAYALMHKHIDWVCVGHFHSSAWGPGFIANGSLPGFSEYAMAIKAAPEAPSQTLFFVNKNYGVNEIRRIVLGSSDKHSKDGWFESV